MENLFIKGHQARQVNELLQDPQSRPSKYAPEMLMVIRRLDLSVDLAAFRP